MSRSGRGPADPGLRRSSRQRRQVYDTLDQQFILDRHFNPFLFSDDDSSRRTRNLRSATVHEVDNAPMQPGRSTKRRPSSEHGPSREVMALRSGTRDHEDSGEEEILDIYSRVKRRRRCSQRAYIVEPIHHDDSNPSTITEGDSDLVANESKQGPPKQLVSAIDPESSDSDLAEVDAVRQRYYLRPQKPITKRFEVKLPEPKRRRLEFLSKTPENDEETVEYHAQRSATAFHSPAHRRKRRKSFLLSKKPSDSSSDTDDSGVKYASKNSKKVERARARFLPFNLNDRDVQRSLLTNVGRPRHGASCADVDPMHIDSAIGFDSVGGLTQHIYSLKEMILFPLMYPDVFAKFKINPPRGVLFYGPPGTGKTLVARALANECSKFDRKVAFFMRKGADCLSKWVGESERQLRLLFDQAYSMRPSIIFFDEIDGLAPVRSSRQDQIHSSIVSTLLALMDGLDNRSEVVVIGATNRLDSIDPALRRPGRFDRELRFAMPDQEARKQILHIHTKDWTPPLGDELLTQLAARTVGYGGADLKGVCAEAAFVALRKAYPQIYAKEERLAVDPDSIQVKEEDFLQAMEKQLPCSERSLTAPVRAVSKFMDPLIGPALKETLSLIPADFMKKNNSGAQCITDVQSVLSSLVKRPAVLGRQILLCGRSADCGQTKYFAPAILHALDHLPVYSLAIPNLYSSGTRTPEECVAETLTMASRCGPCVLYLPAVDSWVNVVSNSAWVTFTACLGNWTAKTPVLLLATAHCSLRELDDEIKSLFPEDGTVEIASTYHDAQRRAYFEQLLMEESQLPPANSAQRIFEELPLAPPPPPRQFTAAELKELHNQEESILRELRIFLREIALRLFRDRKFSMFAKPVDAQQTPDYYEIVQTPMDLSTMMSKVDQHKYETVAEFLADIDLITQNALEYNPDNDQADKIIRHRACDLRDVAYALIDSELDWDFEEKCKEIKNARRERGESGPVAPPPPYVYTAKTGAVTGNIDLTSTDDVANEAISGEASTSVGKNSKYMALRNKGNGPAVTGAAKAAAIVKKYKKNAARKCFPWKRRNHRSIKKTKRVRKDQEQEDVQMEKAEEPVEEESELNTTQDDEEGEEEKDDEEGEEEKDDEEGEEEKDDEEGEEEKELDEVQLPEPPKVDINIDELDELLDDVVYSTKQYSLVALERIYVEMEVVIGRYANVWDRRNLVGEIRSILHIDNE